MDLKIRRFEASDLAFFKNMFYESLFVPPGKEPFPFSIIDTPELSKYYQNWGQKGDRCYISEFDGIAVGACWTRYFTAEHPGYGYVAQDMPELGIALEPEWTGRGFGSTMMSYLLDQLRQEGCRGVSLSVDVRNRAIKLCKRLRFEEVEREADSVAMVLYL